MLLRATEKVKNVMSGMTLNQTMLRIKDPKKSVAFYQKNLNMHLLQILDFPDYKFSLYFLVTLPNCDVPKADQLVPKSKDAAKYLLAGTYGCVLELTHNHEEEENVDTTTASTTGTTTVQPLGFKQIGFLVDNVAEKVVEWNAAAALADSTDDTKYSCDVVPTTTTAGSTTSSTCTLTDPDGYEILIQERTVKNPDSDDKERENQVTKRASFHHVTLRIKDPEKSLNFYSVCGMTLVKTTTSPQQDFTSYYFGSAATENSNGGDDFDLLSFSGTLLELRHYINVDEKVQYHNGNTYPKGFGHLAFMVNDVYATSEALEQIGVRFKKKPDEGNMKGLAFIIDPDNYWIEILEKNKVIK